MGKKDAATPKPEKRESVAADLQSPVGSNASTTAAATAAPPVKAPHIDAFEANEHRVALGLLFLSIITRFYRLDKPAGVVFDEFHFGRFTNQYMRGEYLFDIHPPLGKLVLYLAALLVGYSADTCAYDNIHDAYGPDCKFIWLRATAATFGAATSIVLFYIIRNFGGTVKAATLGTLFFVFDSMNAIESRLILIDSQLIFWCAVTLLVAQYWWMRWNVHFKAVSWFERTTGQPYTLLHTLHLDSDNSSRRARVLQWLGLQGETNSRTAASAATYQSAVQTIRNNPHIFSVRARLVWAVVIGICCANCISVKFTGLATPGMIAVESFFALFFLHRAIPLPDLLVIAVTCVTTFVSYYAIHFNLLRTSGDGDAFMSVEFQATLKNSAHYDPEAPFPAFLPLVLDLNREMIAASARIEQRHAWESTWLEWPINARGVLYYSKAAESDASLTEIVYLLGNPLVVWVLLVFLVSALLTLGFYTRYRSDIILFEMHPGQPFRYFFATAGYCICVYALNLMPYIAVKRSCFIYHYMPALMYAQVAGGLLFDQMLLPKWRAPALALLTLIMAASYVYFSPWVYATPMTSEAHDRRRWLPRWN